MTTALRRDLGTGAYVGEARQMPHLEKIPSGIAGLDEIMDGGLPRGRPILVCGGPGCGKTLMGMEFLVRGCIDHGDPGVFLAFEETAPELAKNVASLGFDLGALVREKRLRIDHVHVSRADIEETGEFDLDGLFIRLEFAIKAIGARRVVLDTLESLFSSLPNPLVVRSELRRLFHWLKDHELTTIITAERGRESLTQHGLEEYVSDCVILLDQRVVEQVSTRRLRVLKYRGSKHGTNEYPFLIDDAGVSVLPITSIGVEAEASDERVSTGIERLDTMLGGEGIFRGTLALVSGTSGSGKTTISAHFANAACARGERVLWLALEESASQIVRNMRSVGLDLQQWFDRDLLRLQALRPAQFGLETHLAFIHKLVRSFRPHCVIVDPITSYRAIGSDAEVKAMFTRLSDFFKVEGITGLYTSLTRGNAESTDAELSSLIDTWILLRNLEANGERNRGLYVLKSRGMPHSNQIREFRFGPRGPELVDVYVGAGGVLTGSARLTQEAAERAARISRTHELERQKRTFERQRLAFEAKVAALRAEYEADASEAAHLLAQEVARDEQLALDAHEMAVRRQSDTRPEA